MAEDDYHGRSVWLNVFVFEHLVRLQMSLHVAKSDQQQQRVAARQKLIILLVGLPARGKTYLANKIMCYMNW